MDPREKRQLIKQFFDSYKPILIFGFLGAITGEFIGEYAFPTKHPTVYGALGGVIGLLIGYTIGFFLKNKINLKFIFSTGKIIDICLGIVGLLISIVSAVASFVQHKWFVLGLSVLMAVGAYGMLRQNIKRG